MTLDEIEVTFFVPCLNEELNIIGAIETILSAVRIAGCSYEIIVVDDHSSDRSADLVEQYCCRHPELPLRLIRNDQRKGLSRNYTDCAFIGSGKYFKFFGGSNMEFVEDVVAVLEKRGEADMILPYLEIDGREPRRRMLSILYTKIVNALTGYSLRYYNGSVLHKRYNVMRWHADTYGYAYQAEIVTRLLNEGMSYEEVPTKVQHRTVVKTKAFSFQNMLSVVHSLAQIFFRSLRRKLYKV